MKPIRNTMPMILFGDRLRALRRQAGLTQQAVADRLQVDRTTYTKYEAGRVSPDQQGLVALAKVFAVTVDHLLGCDESAAPRLHVAEDPNGAVCLTMQEKMLVQMFRQLPPEAQDELTQRIQDAYRNRSY